MQFNLSKFTEILINMPQATIALLENLSDYWTDSNEGVNTWTVKEVVAHLILCEETNWLPRIRIILHDPEVVFTPMDMQAHFEIANCNSLRELLNKFKDLRQSGIKELQAYGLQENDFLKSGIHPVTGKVTLQQVIATWATHDMTHLAQIARIIARQNKDSVGSFKQYLKILN